MADEATTKKIVQQVEYYFGDSNLRKDKYMKERIAENADGWVGIDILLRFNRLKQLSDDAAVIVAALKTSTSGLIEVNDTDTAVRRTNAQVEDADFDKRTVYVKGFPTDSTLDTLQEFFAPLAKVKAIRMRRRFDTKDFKGSIFVEVDTVEAAEKLATEPLKCGERTLLTMMKEAYVTAKKDEREERKKKKETKAASAVKEPASATSTTTATTSTTESTESTEAKDASDDAGPADDTAAAAADDGEATEPEVAIEPGCVVKFSGVGDQCSREDIKEIFGRFGTIGWIDFNRGETEGHVRFRQVEGSEAEEESVAAKAVRELTSDGKECRVRGEEATLTVVTGDEEREYWRKVAESRKRKADSGPRGGHRGGGRGRGGRGGGRGGRGRGGGGRGRGGGGGGGGRKRKAEDSGEGQTAPKMSKAE